MSSAHASRWWIAGAALTAGLSMAGPAWAGGVGIIGTGGLHGERVYYYKENSIGEFEQQPPSQQYNLQMGGGIELALGDKDNKITGLFRLYWCQEAPQQDPADPDEFSFQVRLEPRDIGMIDAGLVFGFLGKPTGFQLGAVGMVGSAFMTTDQTEFLKAQAGLGVSYTILRHVQFHFQTLHGVRYRKSLDYQVDNVLGVRYLFD
jgi:hypothetical protein